MPPITASQPASAGATAAAPWHRQVTRAQWRAFWAVFLGWVVDSFDFNILAFILIDIQRSFTVDRALAGALGTVTLVMRLVGGTIAGTAADRWGRKLPLMLSVLWFSLFACLSGFSTSYAMLLAFRALFGLGMGGEWAAGMPLVLEHWPTRLRGLASGLLLGGWYWGYLLAAAAFQFIYPLLGDPDFAWRAMFWIAIVPALFTLWIRARVEESPVWMERQRQLAEARRRGERLGEPRVSLVRIFQPDLLATTIQTTAVIGSFMCIYYSVNFWYPTFLRDAGRPTLPYLAAFNAGAIAGTAFWGRVSETTLGRRGTTTITVILGIASLPLYLHAESSLLLWLGALMMGAFGMGIWGMAPAYSNERFPTEARGVGAGFCYHAAAAIGALMPYLLGELQDRGFAIADAMSAAMIVSGLCAMVIWLGPETRGRNLE
ncbi:MAG TPA: MFS transporter [Vicinamibacterales bacterium]|nr:MFS transporter [Vicinamibacterales bacterium]